MRKTNNHFFSGFLAIFIAILAFLAVWLWLMPSYQETSLAVSKTNYEVDAAKEKLDSLKVAKTTIDSLGPIVGQMLVAVPPKKDTEGIITSLESIATLNKTYIPSFQISEPTSSKVVGDKGSEGASNIVTVSFSVQGSFNNLMGFVGSVEKDLKFFNVNGITLTSSKDNGLTMTLQLNAYKQNNSASLNS